MTIHSYSEVTSKFNMLKMDTRCYLVFLICFATFCQEMLTLSEEHFEKSLHPHIRNKRIIDRTPNGNKPVTIHQVPYIVNVRRNGFPNCGGSIITSSVIITAAHCVFYNSVYSVLSGSSFVKKGIVHNVTGKIIYRYFNPLTKQGDLALLHISPPIDLIHSPNRAIDLHKGDVPIHDFGTISGWGCTDDLGPVMRYPKELRSTVVPILRHGVCHFFYSYPYVISDENICTYDGHDNKFCGIGDSGGPLVVDGKLVGVLSWTARRLHWETPDVFIKVSHPVIRNWILANSHIIEE